MQFLSLFCIFFVLCSVEKWCRCYIWIVNRWIYSKNEKNTLGNFSADNLVNPIFAMMPKSKQTISTSRFRRNYTFLTKRDSFTLEEAKHCEQWKEFDCSMQILRESKKVRHFALVSLMKNWLAKWLNKSNIFCLEITCEGLIKNHGKIYLEKIVSCLENLMIIESVTDVTNKKCSTFSHNKVRYIKLKGIWSRIWILTLRYLELPRRKFWLSKKSSADIFCHYYRDDLSVLFSDKAWLRSCADVRQILWGEGGH